MFWAIIKDARELKNGSNNYSSNNYDLNKAAKDIARITQSTTKDSQQKK